MNVEMLRRVQKHIAAEPRRWSFGWIVAHKKSPCGTGGCIGGWTNILNNQQWSENPSEAIDDIRAFDHFAAARILGLDEYEADRLFFSWPRQFSTKSAASAVARIEHFIQTEGRE